MRTKIFVSDLTQKFCVFLEQKECDRNKCENGGICQESGNDDFICFCKIGFTGKKCECKQNDFFSLLNILFIKKKMICFWSRIL